MSAFFLMCSRIHVPQCPISLYVYIVIEHAISKSNNINPIFFYCLHLLHILYFFIRTDGWLVEIFILVLLFFFFLLAFIFFEGVLAFPFACHFMTA
ncbi:hypothetical protein BDB01DRAFT_769680 [Pilobolus umbonatus]|nr:hypothetical protein BDB01DRAFT_769680 [Pilobolus umbonatus]